LFHEWNQCSPGAEYEACGGKDEACGTADPVLPEYRKMGNHRKIDVVVPAGEFAWLLNLDLPEGRQ
jgi:hypothetical protein